MTKFNHVIANLSQQIATEVRDLLMNTPTENPYDALKETFIKMTLLSKQRCLQELPNVEELKDQKPTKLLHKMKQLLGEN